MTTRTLSQLHRKLKRHGLECSGLLRKLASEVTRAEERERQRVATVLHEDLQQILVGAKLDLAPLTQYDVRRSRR